MTYRCVTRSPLEVGGRTVWQVAEATLDGDGIHATLAAPGSDWMLDPGDGMWRPDVRVAFTTNDGAAIALSYRGLVEQTDTFVSAAQADRATRWDDQYMRMALWFETADDRYLWLMRSLFVARGRLLGTGQVEYEVHRVT
jgi:hypothetical protein